MHRFSPLGFMLVICLALALGSRADGIERLVPGQYAKIGDAIAAASAGDVIRITDSGIYFENVTVNKPVQLIADAGRNPVIRGVGNSGSVLRTFSGADGAQIGSSSGGRITIDAANDATHQVIVRPGHSAGESVIFENLLLTNPAEPPAASVQAIYPTAGGNSTFVNVDIDGGDRLGVGLRLDQLGGGTLTCERVRIRGLYPVLGGASLAVYASSLAGDLALRQCEVFSFREAILLEGDNGVKHSVTIEESYIEKAIDANFDAIQVRGRTDLTLSRSVVVSQFQGRAVHLNPASGATMSIDHCDLIAPYGVTMQAGSGRALEISNSNVVALQNGIQLAATAGGETYVASHNNVIGTPAYSNFPVGVGDVSPAIAPNYANSGAGDYRYNNAALLTADEAGQPVGSYRNLTDVSQQPEPVVTPTPEPTPPPDSVINPWSSAQDQAYVTAFRQLYPARSSPITIEQYLTTYPYDRFIGSSLTSYIARMYNGTYTPFWGFDYWMDSLNIMYRATRDLKYLRENRRLIEAILDYRDDQRGVQLYDGSIAPGWGTSIYSSRGREVYAVHTGMIVYPMLDFLAMCSQEQAMLDELGAQFNVIRDMALESLAYHDPEYRTGPTSGEGHYFFVNYAEPQYNNTPMPGNMQSAIGRALWTSWLLTGNATHRDRAREIGLYIKRRLYRATDGASYWEYQLPDSPVSQAPRSKQSINSEDTSHAWLTAALPALLAANGEVFSAEDMRIMCYSVTRGCGRLPNGVMLPEVNGNPTRFGPGYSVGSSRWLVLAPWSDDVFDNIARYLTVSIADPDFMDCALLTQHYNQRANRTGAGKWALFE